MDQTLRPEREFTADARNRRRRDETEHDTSASVIDLLGESVRRRGDGVAIVEVGGSYVTYEDLWDRCAAVAGGLAAAGIGTGERVVIDLPNGLGWCIAAFGAIMAGAVVVPVSPGCPESARRLVIKHADARCVFADAAPPPTGPPRVLGSRGSDPAAAVYTSPVSGRITSMTVSHANLLAEMTAALRSSLAGVDASTRLLISSSLSGISAFAGQLLPILGAGATAVLMPSFNLKRFLQTIVEYRTDVVAASRALFWLATDHPQCEELGMSHVRLAACGDTPMGPVQRARMAAAFPNARITCRRPEDRRPLPERALTPQATN